MYLCVPLILTSYFGMFILRRDYFVAVLREITRIYLSSIIISLATVTFIKSLMTVIYK